MSCLKVRKATGQDFNALVDLFSESVHQLASQSYTGEQVGIWAPILPDYRAWKNRLEQLVIYVAERDFQLAGFVAILPPSHIELLFTHPNYARQGVASALYKHVINDLLSNNLPVTVDASWQARPFFEAQGWQLQKEEQVELQGVMFSRFKMTLFATESGD